MGRSGITTRLLLVMAVGLAVRAWVASVSPAISRDTCRFVWYAQGLESAFLATLRSEHQHPLYPGLIAAAHGITGPCFEDPVLAWQAAAQAVALAAGVLVSLAMYWLTRQLFDGRTALLAALFAALLPEAVRYSADGLSDLPHALLYLTALAVGVGALRSGLLWQWAVAGLCGGLAFLVRPEGLETVIVVGLLTCLGRLEISRPRRLAGVALLVVVAGAVCGPYMAVTGQLVPKKDPLRLFDWPVEQQAPGDAEASSGLGRLPPKGPANGGVVQAAALPGRVAGAVYLVLKHWVRASRVVYLLVALAAWWGATRPRAERTGRRVVVLAWSLHFLVLVALVINYDYEQMLSKRHALLLAVLILPYSAAGALRLIDGLAARIPSPGWRRAAAVAVVAAVVVSPAHWMLRPINPDTEYLVRAGRWLGEHRAEVLAGRPGPGLLMTADNRIPFYARMRMQNWDEASGDVGVLADHLRSFRPDLVAIDEYRLLRRNPDFMWELEERLVRSGVLEVLHREVPTEGRRRTCLWIYRVGRIP